MKTLDPRSLPLETKVAQLFCLAFPESPIADAVADLERYAWGGYIYDCRRDDRAMLDAVRAAAPIPLLLAADLERGAGQHVAEATLFPHLMALAATGNLSHAYDQGRLTALEARAAGLNWVLAPVADVNSNPANPIINIRSFGSDPSRVAAFVKAFVQGCQAHGAIACVKHFPGHGDTAEDSHSRLATNHASLERLKVLEWLPFQAAIQEGVGSIMSAHVSVPALDPSGLPTTLSGPAIAALRETLGYQGLIVTDALNMGGITETYEDEEAVVRALLAGCDVLLMPRKPQASHAAILKAIAEGVLTEARIDESLERVLALKRQVAAAVNLPDPRALKTEAETLAVQIATEALTLSRGDGLPWPVASSFSLVLDDDNDQEAYQPWLAAHQAAGLKAPRMWDADHPLTLASLREELTPKQPVICAIFSTIKAWKERVSLNPADGELLNGLAAAGHPLCVVSFSNPYLSDQLQGAHLFLCAYSDHPESQQAALAALRGKTAITGQLPVSLPSLMA